MRPDGLKQRTQRLVAWMSYIKRHLLQVLGAVAAVAAVVLVAVLRESVSDYVSAYGFYAIAALLVIVSVLFLSIFVGELNESRMSTMFGFSYCFMLVAVFAPLLIVLPLGMFTRLHDSMLGSPIGLIPVCDSPSTSGSNADCKRPQWVLNIGGFVSATERSRAIGDAPAEQVQASQNRTLDARPQLTSVSGAPRASMPTSEGAGAIRSALGIDGGLAVPLYFITLALMGAAVGMARRVPEYQRRYVHYTRLQELNDDSRKEIQDKATGLQELVDTGEGKLMPPELVRERILFQIAQVASAPLIAIAAYHVFSPGDVSTTVAVGFTSGFASEPILMVFRRVAEAVAPPTTTKAS